MGRGKKESVVYVCVCEKKKELELRSVKKENNTETLKGNKEKNIGSGKRGEREKGHMKDKRKEGDKKGETRKAERRESV